MKWGRGKGRQEGSRCEKEAQGHGSTDRFENDFHDLSKHGLDIGDTGTRVGLGVVHGRNEMASEGHGWRKEGQGGGQGGINETSYKLGARV